MTLLMKKNLSDKEARNKMEKLITEIHICMFCTMRDDGFMHSRPMTTIQIDEENAIWFFCSKQTDIIDELKANQQVCLNYSDPKSQDYLCVMGNAALIDDRDKIKELWDPVVSDFFTDGITDQDIVLIKATPIEASYWNVGTKKMETLFEMIDSMLSHDKLQESEHGKLNL